MSLVTRCRPSSMVAHRAAPPPVIRKIHPLPQHYTREAAIALRVNYRAVQTLPRFYTPPQTIKRQYSVSNEKVFKGYVQAFAENRISFSRCVTGCVMEAVENIDGNLSLENQLVIEDRFQDFNTTVNEMELSTTDVEILTATYKNTLHEMIKEKWIHQIAHEFSPIQKIDNPTEKARTAVEWIDVFFAGVDYFAKIHPQSENWAKLRDLVLFACPPSERNLLARCVWFGHVFRLYNTSTQAQIRLLAKNFQDGELP